MTGYATCTVRDLRRVWMPHKELLSKTYPDGSHTAIRFHRACSWLAEVEKLASAETGAVKDIGELSVAVIQITDVCAKRVGVVVAKKPQRVTKGTVSTSFHIDFIVVISSTERYRELLTDINRDLAKYSVIFIGSMNVISKRSIFRIGPFLGLPCGGL